MCLMAKASKEYSGTDLDDEAVLGLVGRVSEDDLVRASQDLIAESTVVVRNHRLPRVYY